MHFVDLSACQFSSQNLQWSSPANERLPDPLVHLRLLEFAGAGHTEVAYSSKSAKTGCKLYHRFIPLLFGGDHCEGVDVVALLHHGQHLDLLQQVRHGDGVDSVPQCLLQGTSEGVIGTVCELVLQFVATILIGESDILVPLSGEELEGFLTAAATDLWSGYLGKLDLLGNQKVGTAGTAGAGQTKFGWTK